MGAVQILNLLGTINRNRVQLLREVSDPYGAFGGGEQTFPQPQKTHKLIVIGRKEYKF